MPTKWRSATWQRRSRSVPAPLVAIGVVAWRTDWDAKRGVYSWRSDGKPHPVPLAFVALSGWMMLLIALGNLRRDWDWLALILFDPQGGSATSAWARTLDGSTRLRVIGTPHEHEAGERQLVC
jgi:hypothetical protein